VCYVLQRSCVIVSKRQHNNTCLATIEPSKLVLLQESHSSPSSSHIRPLLTRVGLNFHVVEQNVLRRLPDHLNFVERGPILKFVTGVFHSMNVLTPAISVRVRFQGITLTYSKLFSFMFCLRTVYPPARCVLYFCTFPLSKFHCHKWRLEELTFCVVLILILFGRNLVLDLSVQKFQHSLNKSGCEHYERKCKYIKMAELIFLDFSNCGIANLNSRTWNPLVSFGSVSSYVCLYRPHKSCEYPTLLPYSLIKCLWIIQCIRIYFDRNRQ
jgi:hypothetical protein